MVAAFRLTGLTEFSDALKAMATRVNMATPIALVASAALVEGKARANLSRYSHKRGTPTPSPPGRPPALIDGNLRSGWEVTPPVPRSPGTWACTLRPTVVYAGIQEYGGRAGRGGASVLPPRPYLRPAVEDAIHSGVIGDTFTRAWAQAIRA